MDALNRIKLDQGAHGGCINEVDAPMGWTHKCGRRTNVVDAQIGWMHKLVGRTNGVDAQMGWTHNMISPDQDQT